MDPMSIVYPVLSVGGIGVVFGACLGVASQVFKVDEDPRVSAVLEALPGANCGGCGFPGCGGCASAIVAGTAPVNACPVGGAAVAEKVGSIMGIEASASEPMAAFVKCGGTCEKAKEKYDYFGIDDCNMAVQLAGQGAKSCSYGCLGLGSCKKACAFGAIEIVDGIAVIDKEKCVACGKCVEACPLGLVTLVPYTAEHLVQCNSHDKGKDVKAKCDNGCIGCTLCTKQCEFDAIHMDNNVAVIDYEKCTNCGKCAAKCPVKVII